VVQERKIKVNIPAGIEDGLRIRLMGEGEAGIYGGEPGDLYVEVRVKEDPLFHRDGKNLIYEPEISYVQAILGTYLEVPLLDEMIEITVPSGLQPGEVIKIKGKGMPSLNGSKRGDLLVRPRIVIPQRLSPREKELLEEIADIRKEETYTQDKKGIFSKVREIIS